MLRAAHARSERKQHVLRVFTHDSESDTRRWSWSGTFLLHWFLSAVAFALRSNCCEFRIEDKEGLSFNIRPHTLLRTDRRTTVA